MSKMTCVHNFKKFFLKILLITMMASILVKGHTHSVDTVPEFLAPLENLTATQGRDVSFTCTVNNLGLFRVAWIKSDSTAILALNTHMVALNQRLSVTHNGHNTWKLHIAHVQLNDSGSYMCQVNTDPMRSQSGHLNVVVPPDILNEPDSSTGSLDEGATNEGGQIQLVCIATGVPAPSVQWRREGGKDIVLRSEGRDKQFVKHVEGERLTLQQVQRTDMGGYLCIASNGIPPSVSKRFDVQVNFPPTVKAINQLVGAPVGSHVLLECLVEVFPKPLNGWYRNDGSAKIHDGQKHTISEGLINAYTWQMNLTIRHLQKDDFGAYICTSVNAVGKQDARIRLQELRLPKTKTTTPTPYVYTTVKQRGKALSHNNKVGHDMYSFKEAMMPNNILDNEIINTVEVHTQVPVRPSSGIEKAKNTQMPAASVPSQGTPWVAWIKSHSTAILALHTHMVALNQRLSVTHNGHNTWKLHIAHVQLNDSGSYMCQVNTDPMRSQSGHLNVVVPPDILNEPDSSTGSLDEGATNEGGQIQLVCIATGVPAPSVQWRREGGKDIVLRSEGRDKQFVKHVEGERLTLQQVQRTDMGGYLCIASNGIPPSVSKRFDVQVNFPPTVKAINQLVGAPVGSHVLLECLVEVFPKPLNGWYRNDGSAKIHDGQKHTISEGLINAYTWQMNLTIRHLQKDDFGAYICTSVNAVGKQDARIRLQVKQRGKALSHNNKVGHDMYSFKEAMMPNNILDNEIINTVEVHTQVPVRPSSGIEKAKNTQMPAASVPSQGTPWVYSNVKNLVKANLKILTLCLMLLFLLL